MNHKREGYYVVIEFTAEPEPWPTWTGSSDLADEVLRHKVMRMPGQGGRSGRRPHAGRGSG